MQGGGFSSSDHFELGASDPNAIAGLIFRNEPGDFFGVCVQLRRNLHGALLAGAQAHSGAERPRPQARRRR